MADQCLDNELISLRHKLVAKVAQLDQHNRVLADVCSPDNDVHRQTLVTKWQQFVHQLNQLEAKVANTSTNQLLTRDIQYINDRLERLLTSVKELTAYDKCGASMATRHQQLLTEQRHSDHVLDQFEPQLGAIDTESQSLQRRLAELKRQTQSYGSIV